MHRRQWVLCKLRW